MCVRVWGQLERGEEMTRVFTASTYAKAGKPLMCGCSLVVLHWLALCGVV